MIDYFWWYVATMGFLCVFVAIMCLYRYFLGNRLIEQTKKLRAEINRVPKEVLDFSRNPSENIGSAIGDIGIEGIMEELGIDPGLLKNPLVKGLIEKYAPRVLESMGKNGKNTKTEEIPLL